MAKLRLLLFIMIISAILLGCVFEANPTGSSFKIINKYYQPINTISISEITDKGIYGWYYFPNLNITEGNSKIFELDYAMKPFKAEVIVSFNGKYDIKDVNFNLGKTTILTLNKKGILE